jgi:uncharacterized protein
MLFTFYLLDRPGAAEMRANLHPEHRSNLATMADQIAFAGPLTEDDTATPIGSLLVIDFPSRDAAHLWLANEPFYRAGVYASATIHAFVNRWPQKTGFPAAA